MYPISTFDGYIAYLYSRLHSVYTSRRDVIDLQLAKVWFDRCLSPQAVADAIGDGVPQDKIC